VKGGEEKGVEGGEKEGRGRGEGIISSEEGRLEPDWEKEGGVATQHTFRLAVLAQERRVDNNAVAGALELGRQLQRLGKVVVDKLGEDGEAVVMLEEHHVGLGLVCRGGGLDVPC
jgi:hypothetical protein